MSLRVEGERLDHFPARGFPFQQLDLTHYRTNEQPGFIRFFPACHSEVVEGCTDRKAGGEGGPAGSEEESIGENADIGKQFCSNNITIEPSIRGQPELSLQFNIVVKERKAYSDLEIGGSQEVGVQVQPLDK